MNFKAAIPSFASAINIGGGQDDCVRIKLDCYLSASQIQQLMELRGCELTVEIKSGLEE